MRWPWQHVEVDLEAARLAEEKAKENWPEVREAAERVKKLDERNGFAEAIRAAMGAR